MSSARWLRPPEYLDCLPNVRLLVLGPYKNGGARRLKKIRHLLFERNLKNSRLVLDFDTPVKTITERSYDLRKSEYWINQADLILLLFFSTLDSGGVTMELEYCIKTNRESHCIVAYKESQSSSISGMIKQKVKRYNRTITEIWFQKNSDLRTRFLGTVTGVLEEAICQSLQETYWGVGAINPQELKEFDSYSAKLKLSLHPV